MCAYWAIKSTKTYTTSQRQANEQVKTQTNALGVLIDEPKEHKHSQQAKG